MERLIHTSSNSYVITYVTSKADKSMDIAYHSSVALSSILKSSVVFK